jgi:hypothetical protein
VASRPKNKAVVGVARKLAIRYITVAVEVIMFPAGN